MYHECKGDGAKYAYFQRKVQYFWQFPLIIGIFCVYLQRKS